MLYQWVSSLSLSPTWLRPCFFLLCPFKQVNPIHPSHLIMAKTPSFFLSFILSFDDNQSITSPLRGCHCPKEREKGKRAARQPASKQQLKAHLQQSTVVDSIMRYKMQDNLITFNNALGLLKTKSVWGSREGIGWGNGVGVSSRTLLYCTCRHVV